MTYVNELVSAEDFQGEILENARQHTSVNCVVGQWTVDRLNKCLLIYTERSRDQILIEYTFYFSWRGHGMWVGIGRDHVKCRSGSDLMKCSLVRLGPVEHFPRRGEMSFPQEVVGGKENILSFLKKALKTFGYSQEFVGVKEEILSSLKEALKTYGYDGGRTIIESMSMEFDF